MSPAKVDRNARLRRVRASQASLREVARRFGISVTRVRQVLDETGGDPIWAARTSDLERASEDDLRRELARLGDRIRADLGRALVIADELEIRRTDRILGLPGA